MRLLIKRDKSLSPLGLIAMVVLAGVIIVALLNLFVIVAILLGILVLIGIGEYMLRNFRGDFKEQNRPE